MFSAWACRSWLGLLGVGLGMYGPGNPDAYSCWIFLPNDPPLVCERDGTGCYNPVQPTDHHSGNLPPVVSSCVRDHCVLSLFVNSYRIYLQARTLEAANRNYILPNAISIRDTSAEKIVYERIDFAADSRSPECHSNHSSIVSCTWGALS
jgi:hypothetical protein